MDRTVADIQMKREFTMPRKEVRKQLKNLADQMQDQFQLNCEWSSKNCLDFQRSGASGHIEIHKKEVELTAKLGMLMSAFKGTIEQEISKFMDKHLY